MTQITFVLPFGLPPPELARDLLRALKADALATLIARPSRRVHHTVEPGARTLPHEQWLARQAGSLSAPALMRRYGIAPESGTWFIVNPVNIQIGRQLQLSDPRRLRLSDAHSRALFEAAEPYFVQTGKTLVYGDAHTWFLRADDWHELDTASPDAATGQNLGDWTPVGGAERAVRKLQNDVQMEWYPHTANVEREAQGQAPINSFWLWAPSSSTTEPAPLAATDVPSWLAPQSIQRPLGEVIAEPGAVISGALAGAALAEDWGTWLAQMQQLEQEAFAPLLAALREGRANKIKLLLSHRTALLELTTTRLAQRMFWRRPTLDTLHT